MKRSNFLISFIVLFVGVNTLAQEDNLFKDYTHLKCKGELPIEFIRLTSDKFRKDYEENYNEGLDKEFFLSTRYFIDELLLSGNVLFNEELSNYVNDVAAYVLVDQKELYSKLQFYVLKSTAVNAFSTDQGIIFVTTGLLAHLENEAQLAFILAHEIIHYTNHHVRNSYIERDNIEKGKGKYRSLSYTDKVSKLSIYSKDREFEADKGGLELFFKSEYDIEEIFTSFDVLLYSYLPFENLQFDTAFFNTDILYIPGSLFPDTINPISINDDFDDHLSTHPNIKKRLDAIDSIINDSESKGKKKFIISQERFFIVRNLSRFESINLHLANREYVDVIYNVFLLKQIFVDNKFLEFSLAKAIYGLAKYKNSNNDRYKEVILKLDNVEGELYRLAYFVDKISKKQINVLAYRYVYDLSVKYKDDKLIKKYEKDMLKEMALYSTIKPNELLGIDYKTYSDSIIKLKSPINYKDSISAIENSTLSQYKKNELKESLKDLQNFETTPSFLDEQFYLTALSDLVAEGQIVESMQDYLINQKKEDDEIKMVNSDNKKTKQKSLGIKKIIIVDPYLASYKINNKKKKVRSEEQKVKLNKMYLKKHNRLDMETALIDSKSLTINDFEKYNEIGLLHQWVYELLSHNEISMITSMNDRVQVIDEKYNTEHFLFSGISKGKSRHKFTVLHGALFLSLYGIPLVIVDLLLIHNNFEMVSISLNSESDSIEYIYIKEVKLRATNPIIETYIYDVLYQLNQGVNEK